jgi:hypothetical protein
MIQRVDSPDQPINPQISIDLKGLRSTISP